MVDEAQQQLGFFVAGFGQGRDSLTAHSHQGELRGDEEAVGQDQKQDQQQKC
jgi:hypothetical protein